MFKAKFVRAALSASIQAIALIILTGCATSVSDVQKEEPSFSFTVAQSPAEFSKCVADGDRKRMEVTPLKDGGVLLAYDASQISGVPNVIFILEIIPQGTGSKVTAKTERYAVGGNTATHNIIDHCLKG